MDDTELHRLAVKLVRRREFDHQKHDDLIQEVWFAGWKVRDKSEGYIVKSMLNRLNDCLQYGDSLGSGRHRSIEAVSLDRVPVPLDERPTLGRHDLYPFELGWAFELTSTPTERAVLSAVIRGETPTYAAAQLGLHKSSTSKAWRKLRTTLTAALNEMF